MQSIELKSIGQYLIVRDGMEELKHNQIAENGQAGRLWPCKARNS